MTWSYDSSDLGTGTASARLNMVRMLVGDVDSTAEQVQDEEITLHLATAADGVYRAASLTAEQIAANYARKVSGSFDGMSASFSDLGKHYRMLAARLLSQSYVYDEAGSVGLPRAGGISQAAMEAEEARADRVDPAFSVGQFDNPETSEQDNLT